MKSLLAVPSDAPGGVDAVIAQHFGHCQAFSLFSIEDGRVVASDILPFGAHEHGDCLVPVKILADRGVTAMVAGGMGARPLAGFLNAGIEPLFCGDFDRVGDIVDAFVAGKLPSFSGECACGHHHDGDACDHDH
jgi:predicted Fe-Mo cluster-binding NifX family protein